MSARAPDGHRPLLVLLALNALSLTGSALTYVALPWFVFETTGSAGRAGLTGAAAVAPSLLVGLLGGTLVDRLGFKRTSILADLLSGLGIVAIPLLHAGPGLPFWALLAFVLLANLLSIPGMTARRSLVPELAAGAGMPLERANSAFELIQQVAFLLGPPLGGVLIALLGAPNLLLLDGATFAVSALGVGLLVPGVASAPRTGESYLAGVRAGLGFLWRERVLRALAVSLMLTNLLGVIFPIVLPVYARDVLGSSRALGLTIGAFGLGAAVGAAAYGWRTHRWPRRWLWIGAYLTVPSIYWLLATHPPLWQLAAICGLVGLIGGHLTPLSVTIRHERIPVALRGRVFSAFSAIASGASPLGIALAGLLIDRAGFDRTVLLYAAAYQLVALGMLAVPAFGQLDPPRRP